MTVIRTAPQERTFRVDLILKFYWKRAADTADGMENESPILTRFPPIHVIRGCTYFFFTRRTWISILPQSFLKQIG